MIEYLVDGSVEYRVYFEFGEEAIDGVDFEKNGKWYEAAVPSTYVGENVQDLELRITCHAKKGSIQIDNVEFQKQ